MTLHQSFESLDDINLKAHEWIEQEYNSQHHTGIQMIPIDRFNLDNSRIKFLTNDGFTEELFFVAETRKVSKTNVFSINSQKHERPVDLRQKSIEVRYDRQRRNRFVVYFYDKRMGDASLLDLHFNANRIKHNTKNNSIKHGDTQ